MGEGVQQIFGGGDQLSPQQLEQIVGGLVLGPLLSIFMPMMWEQAMQGMGDIGMGIEI